MSAAIQGGMKPSGIPWVGDVPSNWQIRRLKFIANMKSGTGITTEGIRDGAEYPVYGGNGLRGYTDSYTHDGDFALIGRQGALCGNVNYARGRFWASEHAVVVEPLKGIHVRWLGELLRSMDLNQYSIAAAQPGLAVDAIRLLPAAVPPHSEQRAIAAYLDEKTARIDALIAKKRRFIELLQEKRTALISHAVTRGLAPGVRMKPSRVEWLGDVPEHWERNKLGFMVTTQGGHTPDKSNAEYWRGQIPWVSPKDMKRSVIADSEDHVSESAIDETNLRRIAPPVVLVVVRGMILAHTFPVAITAMPVTINQDIKALTPRPGCSVEYLALLLEGLSDLMLGLVEDSAHGTKALRTDRWKHFGIYLPPPEEQDFTCRVVDAETRGIDSLMRKAETAVTTLQEYRTAVITAAVTGKLTVQAAPEVATPSAAAETSRP